MKFIKLFAAILVGSFLVSCASKDKATSNAKAEVATEAGKAKAKVEKKATMNASSVTCVNGSDTRVLEVVAENRGCELNYTKMGNTNSIANSSNGSSYCISVKDRIVTKLEDAGYSCK